MATKKPQRPVKDLQAILDVPQSGRLDKATRSALEAYQRAASLPVTGVADDVTWKALVQ